MYYDTGLKKSELVILNTVKIYIGSIIRFEVKSCFGEYRQVFLICYCVHKFLPDTTGNKS